MTAEIKEYIDNSIQESEQVGMSGYDSALLLKNSMRTVRSMLDELEQEKNMYNELENKIVRGESIPLMANEEFIEMLEKDTELKENKQ